MYGFRDPKTEELARDFIERVFPRAGRTILGGPSLDVRKDNLHDSKKEFRAELKFVKRSTDDLFRLYRGLIAQSEPSVDGARGLHMNFYMQGLERSEAEAKPKTAIDLILDNARRVDYWEMSKRYVFDLYLSFSKRLKSLEEQKEIYWSTKGRPPDHYARAIALRFAKLYVTETGKLPTVGTASDGDHPSTEYGRYVEELFGILKIETGFRLPAEWAVSQISEKDIPETKPRGLFDFTLQPNLGRWGGTK